MKKLLFSFIALLLLSSCTKNTVIEINHNQQVERLSFASYEDLQYLMNLMNNNDLDANLKLSPKNNLFSSIRTINIEDDTVLKTDLQSYLKTKSDENISVYEAAGYDELIPDKNLACLLNAKAEIEVANTIYKISPQGTYYYDKKLEKEFNENYPSFELSEGVLIDTLTVQLKDGIYRYNTFYEEDCITYNAEDYYEEPEEENENECSGGITKSPTIISQLEYLNYSQYPRYCSDAQSKVGKIFQSLFGRNKSFDYNFTNKKKFSSKFYYYDYVFWSSIGIKTDVKKKSWLIWKKAAAKEIYVGWGDIITKTDLKGNVLEYPSKSKTILINNTTYNQNLNQTEKSVYIFGLYTSQSEIDKIIGKGLKELLSTIRTKIGKDVSSADKLCIIGPKSYYTIFPKGGASRSNTDSANYVFYKDFSLGVTFDLFNLPDDWKQWALSIAKTTYELPNTKLYKGEVRTAVNYDNQIGAMSIYKE